MGSQTTLQEIRGATTRLRWQLVSNLYTQWDCFFPGGCVPGVPYSQRGLFFEEAVLKYGNVVAQLFQAQKGGKTLGRQIKRSSSCWCGRGHLSLQVCVPPCWGCHGQCRDGGGRHSFPGGAHRTCDCEIPAGHFSTLELHSQSLCHRPARTQYSQGKETAIFWNHPAPFRI